MSARRALLTATRRRRTHDAPGVDPKAPPVFWGRIGAYEAVTRHGMLLLLSPEASHPSRRAKSV
ncbi:MAG: hypothetical protein M3450_11665 [Actinomycetota bacterium]|nr:hypothetical protein [Actinomycetota bacterium]